MATDVREHLRKMIDTLADDDLEEARDALSRFAAGNLYICIFPVTLANKFNSSKNFFDRYIFYQF